METPDTESAPRSRAAQFAAFIFLAVVLGAGAFFLGRSGADAEKIEHLVMSNKFIGKDAAGIRELVPGTVFEGATDNATTVARVPGTFGDTYFQVTFKDGKVIGARTMNRASSGMQQPD